MGHIIFFQNIRGGIVLDRVQKLGQFAMTKTCENWLGELWNTLSETVLSKCMLFGIKDPLKYEISVKFKSNLCVGHVFLT